MSFVTCLLLVFLPSTCSSTTLLCRNIRTNRFVLLLMYCKRLLPSLIVSQISSLVFQSHSGPHCERFHRFALDGIFRRGVGQLVPPHGFLHTWLFIRYISSCIGRVSRAFNLFQCFSITPHVCATPPVCVTVCKRPSNCFYRCNYKSPFILHSLYVSFYDSSLGNSYINNI